MSHLNEQELIDTALDVLISHDGNKFSSIKILTEKYDMDRSEAIAILNRAANIVQGNPFEQIAPAKDTVQRTLVITHASGIAGCLKPADTVTLDGKIVGTIKNGAKPIVLKIDTKEHTVVAQNSTASAAFFGKKNKFAIVESEPPVVYVVPEGSDNIAIEERPKFLKWIFEEIPFAFDDEGH